MRKDNENSVKYSITDKENVCKVRYFFILSHFLFFASFSIFYFFLTFSNIIDEETRTHSMHKDLNEKVVQANEGNGIIASFSSDEKSKPYSQARISHLKKKLYLIEVKCRT